MTNALEFKLEINFVTAYFINLVKLAPVTTPGGIPISFQDIVMKLYSSMSKEYLCVNYLSQVPRKKSRNKTSCQDCYFSFLHPLMWYNRDNNMSNVEMKSIFFSLSLSSSP